MTKRVLVCGAGGFIGGHLVKRLKSEGYWVRGVDLKLNEFSPNRADEFVLGDLRDPNAWMTCTSWLPIWEVRDTSSPGNTTHP
jgi:nucleoside-diphosphate-sugar epimerase